VQLQNFTVAIRDENDNYNFSRDTTN